MTNTFVIPKNNVDWLQRRVNTLNKKAVKLGVPEMELEILGPSKPINRVSDYGAPYFISTVLVELTGEIPKVSGWSLIARLNRTPAGNVISGLPGAPSAPDRAKTFYGCDHCGYKRKRKDIFVLKKDDEFKIVGRTCLTDFFGGSSPDALINYAKMIDRFLRDINRAENDEPIVQNGRDAYPLSLVLNYTGAEIAAFGWISASKSGIGIGLPTKKWVGEYLEYGTRGRDRQIDLAKIAREKGYDPNGTEALAEIEAALLWAGDLEGKNDYEWSIRSIALTGFCTWRQLGFACSILPAYRNFLKRKKPATPRVASTYVGTVGDRINVGGKIVFLREYDTTFGYRTLVKILTDAGQLINWWATEPKYKNAPNADLARGDSVTLDAKVKGHGEYKGEKQTTVNYGKVFVR